MSLVFGDVEITNNISGVGLSSRRPARIATTVAGTLSSSFANGQLIDNVTLVTGDRILIKNQSNPIENGVYEVQTSGSPIRTPDYSDGDAVSGASIFIQEGTINNGTEWLCVSLSGSDIVNTDPLEFKLTSGDVSGQGISTDNAIPRWDGTTGTYIQDSSILIDDSNNMTGLQYTQFSDITAPTNPSDGQGRLYKKTGDDGFFWLPDSAGTEIDLTTKTIIVQDQGTNITGTPHTTFNFTGNAVVAADAGSGVAEITISAVTTFSGDTTGLTPATVTSGDVVLGGILNATHGGTGQNIYAVGDILYADTTTTLMKLPKPSVDSLLTMNGSGNPAWGNLASYLTYVKHEVIVKLNASSGTFTSVADAIASIPVSPTPDFPTATNQWIVRVHAGTYYEPQLVVPDHVLVVGTDMQGVQIYPSSMGYSLFKMRTNSGVAFIATGNSDPDYPCFDCDNCGNFVLLHKVTVNAGTCDRWLSCVTDNTATENSVVYLEYCDTTDSNIYTILAQDTNIGGGFGSQISIENFFTVGHNDDSIIVDGLNTSLLSHASEMASDGIGNCIHVKNGAMVNIRGMAITSYTNGIVVDNDASTPKIFTTGIIFQDCTSNVVVNNDNAVGHIDGYTEYVKTYIPKIAPLFITNKDQHIITVGYKGADFTTIGAALAAITDNSFTHRYTITVNPGTYVETQLQLKSYVTVQGLFQTQCLVVAHPSVEGTPFILGAGYAALDKLTFAVADYAHPPSYMVEFMGDPTGVHFRVDNCVFDSSADLVHVGSTSGPSIFLLLNTLINMAAPFTNGILIEDSGPSNYPISYIIDNLIWNADTTGLTNFNNLLTIQSYHTTGINIFGAITNSSMGQSITAPVGTGIVLEGFVYAIVETCIIGGFSVGYQINSSAYPTLGLMASTTFSNDTMDIDILSTNSYGTITCNASLNKVHITNGSTFGTTINDPSGSIILTGQIYQGVIWTEVTNITEQIQHAAVTGSVDAIPIITAVGGLNVSVTGGAGYTFLGPLINDYIHYTVWSAVPSLALPDNSLSWVYVDGTSTVSSSTSRPNYIQNIILGTVKTYSGNVTYIQLVGPIINNQATETDQVLRILFGPVVKSGCIASPGSSLTSRAVAVSSGSYYLGSQGFTPGSNDNVTMIAYHGGTVETTITQVPLQWDNAGTLTSISSGKWVRHQIYLIGDLTNGATYFLVYGQQEFNTEADADSGPNPNPPTSFVENMCPICCVVVTNTDPASPLDISRFIDTRPIIGSNANNATSSNDHNSLANLTVGDAHPQYFRTDGTRVMTGNIQVGTSAITWNVPGTGVVDGVTITDHASRHLPGGADPLATAAPVSIGSTNQLGSANAFARSDHVHQGVLSWSAGTTGLTPNTTTYGAVTLGGTLIAVNGGTGFSSYTVGDLLFADTSTTLAKLADVATGNVLLSGGVGVAPLWGTVNLSTAVNGVLPVANGGTALSTTPTNGQLLIGNGTNYTLSTLTAGTAIGITNASGSITINNTGVTSLTGTTNQVTASASTGAVTLSTPSVFIAPGTIQDTTGMLYSTSDTVSAAGTTQGTATALTRSYVVVTTAAVNSGVVLPTPASAGYIINIINRGANAVNVYPASGGTIDTAAANAAISLPVGGSITLQASSTTQWFTVNPPLVAGTAVSVVYGNGRTTLNNTGVTSIAGTANQITMSAATGAVTASTPAIFIAPGTIKDTTGMHYSTNAAVSAAGTTQGTATLLTTSYNVVSTVAAGSGVVLPLPAATGYIINIVNKGANSLNIYPNTGDIIDSGAANAPISLPVNATITLQASTLGQWYTVNPPIIAGTGTTVTYGNGSTTVSGSGLVNVQDEGSAITGTPHSTLNFVGPRVTASNAGGGVATITIPALLTTKGDIFTYDTAETRLAVGSNDQSLLADSTTATGLRWAAIVNSNVAGTGISVSGATGNVTITNTGVTSLTTNTGLSTNVSATGAVTVTNTGVLSWSAGTTGLTPNSATTGAVTLGGTLIAVNGGTGFASYAVGDLLYANTTTTLAKLADVATGNVLLSGGVNTAPLWGKVSLTAAVSGVLPIISGGTALSTTPTNGQLLIGNGSSYTLATLTAGTAIGITNASGSITIDNTGVTSLTTLIGLSINASATGDVTVTNTGVLTFTSNTGLSSNVSATGDITVTNTGVLSNIAGTGISVSGATGNVTITNTGVTSLTGTANQVSVSASTGSVTLSTPSVFIAPGTIQDTSGMLYSTNAGVSAAGTNQATATALTKSYNVVTTVASGSGVALPTPGSAGYIINIVNKGANALLVYPAVGGTIDNAALNAAVSLPVGATATYQASSTTQWYTVNPPIIAGTGTTVTYGNGATTVAGSGLINVQDEGSAIAGTPHTTLNFVGSRVTASNAGGGVATVTIPALLTTKGDIFTYDTAETRLAVGTNNQALIADSTTGTGLRWAAIVNSNVAGTGISVSGATGNVTITNTGVTSLTTNTGLSVNASATGAVTVTNTGVLSWSAGTTGLTPNSATTGAVTLGGTLIAVNGGTGFASYAVGDLLYANTTTTLAKLADAAIGNVLISGGVNTAPQWGKVSLTAAVSGVLPIANGGTALSTTPTNGQLLIGNGTNYTLATLTAGTAIGITNASGSITINNTGVTSLTTNTGLSTNVSATGAVTVTNTGVLSNVAGTGISVSGATGNVTITNTGVTSLTGTANQVTVSASTGAITLSTPVVFIAPGTIQDTSGMLYSTSAAVSAAGTNQAGATALTKSYNVVTTVASGSGVALPTPASAGYIINVVNKGANALLVYPASSGAIDSAGTNIPVSLPVGATVTYQAASTTQWYTVNPPIIAGAGTTVTYGNGATTVAGSGLINVQDEGSAITGTPHSTLNFVGARVTASNAGGGVATINIPAVLTTKGDILTYDTAENRLGVGSNNQALVADSTTATGLKWAAIVNSNVAGTGISVSGATGNVTITNTGVTSLTTNTGLSTNVSATGAVTVTNTGVTSFTSNTGLSTNVSATGAVTVTNTGVTSLTTNTGLSTNVSATGAVTVTNTGVTSLTGTANQVTVSASTGSVTLSTPPVFIAPGTIQDTTGMLYSTNAAVSAAGTNQATATSLIRSYNVATTVASGTGVALPTPGSAGFIINIVNRGANTLLVYPATGGAIDSAGTNTAVSLPVGATVTYQASSTTQWYTINPPIVAGAGTTVTYGNGATTVAGSGLINVQEEGSAIVGTPHTTLNFVGARVTASNAGGGVATITIPAVLTTKGDILTYDTVENRLAVGSNNQALIADSTTGTGLRWAAIVNSNVAGTGISVSGATGNVTITNTGVTSWSAGTTGLTPNTATTGAVTLAGTLIAVNGGTGFSSYAVGDLLYADTTTTLAKLADAAIGNVLISGGVNTAPQWGKVSLTAAVSGVLPIANGGTALSTTPTNGQLLIGNGTNYTLATLTAGTAIGITNGAGSITINNTGVTSLTTNTGLSTNVSATGAVTVTNTGVLSNVAGTGISVSGATGNVTITNTGVTSLTGTANQVAVSASTGAITLSTPGVFIAPGTIQDTTGMAYSTSATVSAAGTNQATATQLTTSYNVLTTVASGTGVILPTPSTVGYIINIVNKGANPVNIYPSSTDQIDGLAASLPVVLPVNATITLQASSLTQWFTINPPIVAGTNTTVTYGNGQTTVNSTGIFTLNTLTPQTQTMVTGTAGTNFNIASAGSTHTFNLPSASETNTGVITNTPQTIKGGKTFVKDTPLVSFIGSAVNSGTNVSSLTINVPTGTTTTDMLMLAFITVRNGFSRTNNSVPYTDAQVIATPPAGWVLVNQTTNIINYPRSIFIYIKPATVSEPASYTWGDISPGPANSDTATGTATFATNVMTVTAVGSGTFTTGQVVTATGVTVGTTITAFGSGSGGTGTYTLSTSPGTLTSRAVSATKPKTNFVVGGISTFSNVSTYNSINVLGSQATPSSLTHTTPTNPPVITTTNNTLLLTYYSMASVVTSWTLNSGQTTAANIGTGPTGPTPPQAIGESMVQGYLFNVPSGTLPGYSATASNDADAGLTLVVALRQSAEAIITAKASTAATSALNAGNTIVGTTLTVAGAVTGAFDLGMIIGGGTIQSGTTIVAFGTGTGGTGTYTVSPSQTTTGTFAITGVGQITNMYENVNAFDDVLSGFDTTGQPFFGGTEPPTASVASNAGNNITAGTLNVSGAVTGSLSVGMLITGGTIVQNTRITAFGTGTGGTGTYTVSPVQTTTGGAFAINGVAASSFITLKTETTPLTSSYNVTVPSANTLLVGTDYAATLTNKTMTSNTNNVIARELWVGSGASSVSTYAATAPSVGQVLTATASNTATWQTPSGSSIIVKDEGTNIPNTPHAALNFIGSGITAADGGAGVANITIIGGWTNATVTTSNATATTIATIATASNITYLVDCRFVARRTDVAGTGAGYVYSTTFRNVGGTLTKIGQTKAANEDVAGWDVNSVVSGTNILLQVSGAAASTINWAVNYSIVSI